MSEPLPRFETIDTVVDTSNDTPAFVPFPVDHLGRDPACYVQALADSVGVDPALAASALLAAAGGLIGTTAQLVVTNSWCVTPTVCAVLVAASGSRKTPLMNALLAPIHARQNEFVQTFELALATYRVNLAEFERSQRPRSRTPSNTQSSASTRPIEPICSRLLADNTTMEALIKLLAHNPAGILLHVDEFSRFLGSLDRYGRGSQSASADLSTFLSMIDGSPILSDRVTTGFQHAAKAAVSLLTSIQPDILRSALSPAIIGSGLLARLLLIFPPRKMRVTHLTDLPADVLGWWTECVRTLVARRGQFGSVDFSPTVELTPEAKRLAVSWHVECQNDIARNSGPTASMISKLENYAFKFALIIALLEDQSTGRVDTNHLASGVAMARWFRAEQERIYQMLGIGLDFDRALLDWLVEREEPVTPAEVAQNLSRYKSKTAEARTQLDKLWQLGFVAKVGNTYAIAR